jgi:hypothetical protein
MDRTSSRYAYRCLPLIAANCQGWEILSSATFTAEWDGLATRDPLRITVHEGDTTLVQSHFGHGILTFHVNYLLRTPPGVNLWVKGPANRPKDGIAPLEGVVETDWSPAPFTMNWRFTRPRAAVSFEKDEPFCTVVPIARGFIESFDPEIRDIAEDPELQRDYHAWRSSRRSFLGDLKEPDSEAREARWQKHYFRGENVAGERFDDHQTRISLKPFR